MEPAARACLPRTPDRPDRLRTATAEKLAQSHTAPYQQVIRVRILLEAARGYSNAKIARRQHVTVDIVRTWRGRYADEGVAGLADRP
jgi:hypothetical protein